MLCWCDRFKYFGTHFISDQYVKLDFSQSVRTFYALANAIYSNTRFISEFPRLSLFESYSLTFIAYNCAGLFLPIDQIRELNVCWNNVCMKVFAMNKWESVNCIQFLFASKLFFGRILYLPHGAIFRCSRVWL